MDQHQQPRNEDADHNEVPWSVALHWKMWFCYERRLLSSRDPDALGFASWFLSQYCFGCGEDLECDRPTLPRNGLCIHCRSTQAWRLN